MCFDRTDKRVKPFHVGYRVMKKEGNRYYSAFSTGTMSSGWQGTHNPLPRKKWLDEMAWRPESLLLRQKTNIPVGWHVFSTIEAGEAFLRDFVFLQQKNTVILRVKCYGLRKPYGMGLAYGQPAGRFQFMKILEEVK